MQTDFMVDETVTAASLNNIAIDLGSVDFTHFPETPPQSAVAALNSITADLASPGVIFGDDACNVTLSTDKTKAYVGKGVIVFSDGAKTRITEQQTFDISSINTEKVLYIYASYNADMNTAVLEMSNQYPTVGEYQKIAVIKGADGYATRAEQNRTFCTPKTLSLATSYKTYEINVSVPNGSVATLLTIPKEVWDSANFFMYEPDVSGYTDKTMPKDETSGPFVPIKNLTFNSDGIADRGKIDRAYHSSYYYYITFAKNTSGNIDVKVRHNRDYSTETFAGKVYII